MKAGAALWPLLCFGLVVALRLSTLDNPYYWDEAGAYATPSLTVAQTGVWRALPGCHERGLLLGHPPLLYLIHGSIFRLFGTWPIPHHLVALLFAAIGVWYTFRTGRLLGGQSTGICAALLLLFSPMFFAQSSMVLGDLPIASLGIASAYYLLARRKVAYAVAATSMVQTKETALAVAVAAALYWFFVEPRERDFRSVLMHAIPIGSLAAFFAIEWVATGTLVQASFFRTHPLFIFDITDPAAAVAEIAKHSVQAASILFLQEGRFLLTGTIVLALAVDARAMREKPLLLCGLVALLYWGAFSLIDSLPRYFMPALPFLCIAAARSTSVVVRGRAAWQWAATAALLIVFVSFFHRARSASGNFETNLQHERVLSAMKSACEHVETSDPGLPVVADWPISLYLAVPELGYVRSRVRSERPEGVDLGRGVGPITIVYSSMNPSKEMRQLRERAVEEDLRVAFRIAHPEIVIEVLERR